MSNVKAPITFGTWNVQCGVGTGQTTSGGRAERIAQTATGVDVLLLQEMWFTEPLIAGSERLRAQPHGMDGPGLVAGVLGRDPENVVAYPLSPSHERPGEWMGVAIISRFPVVKSWALELPLPDGVDSSKDWHAKGFCFAVIETPAGRLLAASGHSHTPYIFGLEPLDPALARSWNAVDSALTSCDPDMAAVIGFDGNVDPSDLRQLLPRSLGGDNAPYRRVGFADIRPTCADGSSTDEILVSSSCGIASPRVVERSPADHGLCTVGASPGIKRFLGGNQSGLTP